MTNRAGSTNFVDWFSRVADRSYRPSAVAPSVVLPTPRTKRNKRGSGVFRPIGICATSLQQYPIAIAQHGAVCHKSRPRLLGDAQSPAAAPVALYVARRTVRGAVRQAGRADCPDSEGALVFDRGTFMVYIQRDRVPVAKTQQRPESQPGPSASDGSRGSRQGAPSRFATCSHFGASHCRPQ